MKMAPSSKSERNSGAGSGGGGPGGAGGKRVAGRRREHVLKQLERVKVRPRVREDRARGCGRGTREAKGGWKGVRGVRGCGRSPRGGGSEGGSWAAPRGEGLDVGGSRGGLDGGVGGGAPATGLGWRGPYVQLEE